MKASESRNLWSGFCSGAEEAGRGREAKRALRAAEVGSLEAARRGFLGTRVTGAELRTSDHDTPGSRKRRNVLSVPRTLWPRQRLRKMASILRRREMSEASSFAFDALPPAMA